MTAEIKSGPDLVPQVEQKSRLTKTIDMYTTSLIETGAVKTGRFELKNRAPDGSPVYSGVYVDHGDMITGTESRGRYYDANIAYIEEMFAKDHIVLVNAVSKSGPHTAGALSDRLNIDQVTVLSEDITVAERGTNRAVRLPPKIQPGSLFLIEDDVGTSGKSIITAKEQTIEALRRQRGMSDEEIKNLRFAALVGLARNPEKLKENLAKEGIEAHSLTNLHDVLVKMWPTTSAEQRAMLKSEFPDLTSLPD